MRGEDDVQEVLGSSRQGSPPHARGRLVTLRYELHKRRITPACAGKTRARQNSCPTRRDHPRMRGEDTIIFVSSVSRRGSPPHARGRLAFRGELRIIVGITPACAGKTGPARWDPDRTGDHPRMRGEDYVDCSALASEEGSPPHARGRLQVATGFDSVSRITPACAGKTPRSPTHERTSPDHPRMRGEDKADPCEIEVAHGSPPHARGRQRRSLPTWTGRGITPACAGKTRKTAHASNSRTDHPRMRGEDRAKV